MVQEETAFKHPEEAFDVSAEETVGRTSRRSPHIAFRHMNEGDIDFVRVTNDFATIFKTCFRTNSCIIATFDDVGVRYDMPMFII